MSKPTSSLVIPPQPLGGRGMGSVAFAPQSPQCDNGYAAFQLKREPLAARLVH